MRQKTAKEIQGDIYELLKCSPLSESISGGIYRDGMRPKDSMREDAEIIFTAGLPGQIQTGVVTINVFIPDIAPYGDGTLVEDGARAEEVERLMQDWFDSLVANEYKFELQNTIMTVASDERPEHFVSVALKYRYYGG